ncbi:MAG: hypothetical protein ACTHOF_15085 [Flavisolibacter sp.]
MLTGISDTDKTRLINSFPASLRQDVEGAVKVIPPDHNVVLADGKIHNINGLIHPTEYKVYFDGELLTIPYRLYFNEPKLEKENLLSPTQKEILNCIYLRHHNGFVRQKRLEQLVDTTDDFVIPYTFQLLGEYVMEILVVLDRHINDRTIDKYIRFIAENRRYWQQTESRMISYWNEYYRRPNFKKLSDYIGKQIVDKLKKRTHNMNCVKNQINF